MKNVLIGSIDLLKIDGSYCVKLVEEDGIFIPFSKDNGVMLMGIRSQQAVIKIAAIPTDIRPDVDFVIARRLTTDELGKGVKAQKLGEFRIHIPQNKKQKELPPIIVYNAWDSPEEEHQL